MVRKRFEWKLRDKSLVLGERTLIAGVLNVTPDSFSDGGKYQDPDRAFARAIEMEEQGADVIDIGAESTRPGSARVSEAEELRRLIPVLKRLRNKLTIPISVDTYKASVAEKALDLGVDIINDPTALTWDAELARVVSSANAGLILNHMRGTPETWAKLGPIKEAVRVIVRELDASVHRAVRAGVDKKRIVADPGLGFGKRREQNAEILAQLAGLSQLGLPIMVGPSRKHFLTRDSVALTEFATAAAVTAAILNGAHMVRVHDVAAMKATAEVADEILRETHEEAAVRQPSAPEPRPVEGRGGPEGQPGGARDDRRDDRRDVSKDDRRDSRPSRPPARPGRGDRPFPPPAAAGQASVTCFLVNWIGILKRYACILRTYR